MNNQIKIPKIKRLIITKYILPGEKDINRIISEITKKAKKKKLL